MNRVLFLCESFHPVLGGGEQQLLRLARALVARGDAATVITRRSQAGWPARETLDGVRVIRVPPAGPGRTGKYAMAPHAFGEVLREQRAHDLLVVRGTRVLGLPGLVAARAGRRPVILQPEVNGELSGEIYTWGTPLQGGLADLAVRALVRGRNLWLRDAEAFVAMSREIVRELRAAGVEERRIAHIPHGVGCERFRPASVGERRELRARLGLPAEALVVGYTGRLLHGKGLEALLGAFARLAARNEPAHLLIVGSGGGQALSIEEDLRARVARAGLERRVSFAGRVENVEDFLRAADVFALPSVFEALGLSLVEAAACGLACVGSRTGGIVDVIEDGVSGLLVAPGDEQGLLAALERLAGDASLRARLGERAREVAAERFDERESLRRYRALFAEVAGARRRAA